MLETYVSNFMEGVASEMETRKNFGNYIREKRKTAGLSQKELAQQLFVSESAVSKWERGVGLPDMTLVTSLCEILHVSEHELLTASDDMHQREIEEQSRGYLRILKGYTWVTYLCYLAVLIPCFIGNLVTEHRLSWFFIVVGGLAMVFSFINVPVMTKTRRAEKCFWCFYGSIIYMLCVCRIVLGGNWLIMSLLGVSFGLLGIFLPIILCSWHYDWPILRHKGLICMALDTVLSYLMVFFGCLFYVKGVTGVIIARNLWVLTVFSILAWGIFIVFRYIRCSRLMKTGITVTLCGVWMFFANTLISVAYNRVVRPSVNFHNWMDFGGQNFGLVVLIVGAVIVAASMIRDMRK